MECLQRIPRLRTRAHIQPWRQISAACALIYTQVPEPLRLQGGKWRVAVKAINRNSDSQPVGMISSGRGARARCHGQRARALCVTPPLCAQQRAAGLLLTACYHFHHNVLLWLTHQPIAYHDTNRPHPGLCRVCLELPRPGQQRLAHGAAVRGAAGGQRLSGCRARSSPVVLD